jgi:hypothetical protein
MEPESSLSYSQVPAACPYPEPNLSSPHHPLQLPEDPFDRDTIEAKYGVFCKIIFSQILNRNT